MFIFAFTIYISPLLLLMVYLVAEILGWMENGLEKNGEKIDFISIFSWNLP